MRLYRLSILLSPALAASVLAGCQGIAGTEDRTLNPIITANALPGLGSPSLGNGKIRIANLAVTPGKVDFCIRLAGGSWGYPVMANSGNDEFFRGGLNYPQVTVPFSAPVGNIDVKFVKAGSSCAATAIAQTAAPIAVGDSTKGGAQSAVVTILRYGGAAAPDAGDTGIPESVVGLPEETEASPTCHSNECPRFRVVNAGSWTSNIDFGPADNNALPAGVKSLILASDVPPGSAPSPQVAAPFFPVDSAGYIGSIYTGTVQSAVTLGVTASNSSTPNQAVVIFSPAAALDTQTLYVIGDPNNNIHPLQGLLVEDTKAAAAGPADAGIDYTSLAQATLTTPSTLSVDTLNVALYGLSAPIQSARHQPILTTIQQRKTDVMCILEIESDADKAAVASAAKNGNYGYSYWVATTLTTPPTNSADWFSNTPAPLTDPPCKGVDMATATACAEACSTADAGQDPASVGITSASCLATACTSSTAFLQNVYSNKTGCYDCFAEYLVAGDTISKMRSECGSDTNAPYGQYGFEGANGTLLLSKFPFAQTDAGATDTEAFIFPGSNYRRAIVRARLQLDPTDDSKDVDVYCAQLVTPDLNGSLTYVGQYAAPTAGLYPIADGGQDNGWEDEQNLQARDAIEWILSRSGTTPAVIAGDWHASLAAGGAGGDAGFVVGNHSPEVLRQILDAGFVPAHPIGYTPVCQYCNANPYTNNQVTSDGTTGYDFTTTYLYNFAPNSAVGDSLWGADPAQWNIPLANDAGMGPLSPYYPRTVQILRP